jgi:hypothetical protein
MPDYLVQLIVVLCAAIATALAAFYINWLAAIVVFPTFAALMAWLLNDEVIPS